MKKINYVIFSAFILSLFLNQDLYCAKQKLNIEDLKKPIEPVETKKGVLFTFEQKEAQTVSLAGTFNNWDMNKNPLRKNKKGIWYIVVPLQKGKIEYKFVINSKDWKEDPANKNRLEDTYGGGYKSVFEVKTGINLGGIIIKDKKVSFKYYNPNANSVSLSGSFNEWNISSNPMTKDTDGYWTLELELIAGKYQYKYVVNGSQWISDPMNTSSVDDGFGGVNSTFEIK